MTFHCCFFFDTGPAAKLNSFFPLQPVKGIVEPFCVAQRAIRVFYLGDFSDFYPLDFQINSWVIPVNLSYDFFADSISICNVGIDL